MEILSVNEEESLSEEEFNGYGIVIIITEPTIIDFFEKPNAGVPLESVIMTSMLKKYGENINLNFLTPSTSCY
jgi:hypothetical protein